MQTEKKDDEGKFNNNSNYYSSYVLSDKFYKQPFVHMLAHWKQSRDTREGLCWPSLEQRATVACLLEWCLSHMISDSYPLFIKSPSSVKTLLLYFTIFQKNVYISINLFFMHNLKMCIKTGFLYEICSFCTNPAMLLKLGNFV